jgi:predicted dehydrogenase
MDHVAALTAVRDVEIVAICDLDEKAAREAATFYQSLRDGLPAPVPPEQGVLNVRLMDQIKEACKPFRKQRPELSIQQSPSVPVRERGLT